MNGRLDESQKAVNNKTSMNYSNPMNRCKCWVDNGFLFSCSTHSKNIYLTAMQPIL
jgi:hypothetical protein